GAASLRGPPARARRGRRQRLGGARSVAGRRRCAGGHAPAQPAVDRAISAEKRILLVTGEASGDLHAARLVQALRGLGPVRVRGIAGPALRAAGVGCILAAEELAMVGFSEVVAKLPRILAARGKLLEEWR